MKQRQYRSNQGRSPMKQVEGIYNSNKDSIYSICY